MQGHQKCLTVRNINKGMFPLTAYMNTLIHNLGQPLPLIDINGQGFWRTWKTSQFEVSSILVIQVSTDGINSLSIQGV